MEVNNQGPPTSMESMAGSDGENSRAKVDDTNVIVNYLPAAVNERQLKDLFGVHGTIKSVKIVRDPTTNVRKGYGFVKYSRAEDASAAIAALNGFPVADKKLKVGIARERFDASKSCKLMITNLSMQCTTDEVEALFRKHGEIVQSRMVPHKQNLHRGNDQMCFLLYTTHEAARRALSEPEYVLHGRRLSVTDAIGNQDQQQQQLQQHNRYSQSSADGGDDGSQRGAYPAGVLPGPGMSLQHQQFQRPMHAHFDAIPPVSHQALANSHAIARSASPRGSPYESGGMLSSMTYYTTSNSVHGQGLMSGSGAASAPGAGSVAPPPYYSTMPPQGGGGSGRRGAGAGAGAVVGVGVGGASHYGAPNTTSSSVSAVSGYDTSEGLVRRQYAQGAYQEPPSSSPSPLSSNQGSFRFHGDIMPSTSHDSSDEGQQYYGQQQSQFQYQDPQQLRVSPGQSLAPYAHSQPPTHGQGQGQGHVQLQQPPPYDTALHAVNSANTSGEGINAEHSAYSSGRGRGNSKGRGVRAPQKQLMTSQINAYSSAGGGVTGPGSGSGRGDVFQGSSAPAGAYYYPYSGPHGGPLPPSPYYETSGSGPNSYGGQPMPTAMYISAPAGSYSSSASASGSAHGHGSWSINPLDSGGSGRSSERSVSAGSGSNYGGSGRGRGSKKKSRGGGGGRSDYNPGPSGYASGGAAAQAYQSALSGVTAPSRGGASQPHYQSENPPMHEAAGYSSAPAIVSYVSTPSQQHIGQYSQTHHHQQQQPSSSSNYWHSNPHTAAGVPIPPREAPYTSYSPSSPPSAEMAAVAISDRSKGGQSASYAEGDNKYPGQSEQQHLQQTQQDQELPQQQLQQAKNPPADGYQKGQHARDGGRTLEATSEPFEGGQSLPHTETARSEARPNYLDASPRSTTESGSGRIAEQSTPHFAEHTSEAHSEDAAVQYAETAAHAQHSTVTSSSSSCSSSPDAASPTGPGAEVEGRSGENGIGSGSVPSSNNE